MKGGLDAEVLEARLRELSRRLKRLSARKPASAKALAADEDLQDIVSRNLELAIQACIDVAAHVCGAHGMVPTTSGDEDLAAFGKAMLELAAGER